MGYCIEFVAAEFRVPAENVEAARRAALALVGMTERMGGGSFHPEGTVRFFSWMNDTRFMAGDETLTLPEILDEWRYRPVVGADGSIANIEYFEGEKLGDEDALWLALAPYVEPGSWIQMHGEDGANWRWYFNGVTCVEQAGTVTFEDF